MAAPAPAGPRSGGSKSVLDGMAGPSMKPVELEELAGSSMKPVHLEEMAGPSMKPVHLEEMAGPSMKPVHLEEMAGTSMKPVELEELDLMGDIDKQRLKWETINEDQQVWDALDEQRNLLVDELIREDSYSCCFLVAPEDVDSCHLLMNGSHASEYLLLVLAEQKQDYIIYCV
ncbi:uncharacterized protein LOC124678626 [Lolium rigidum]|uniref:uncharacterized protein LOC124678626 n=1 Tax=Lolium rigidum TaxID=89674 RepID=UPI001F5D02A7|nr:uncharacterized protein LOC124678626 [Lolium rigidum]